MNLFIWKFILLFLSITVLSSCSSALKKNCESSNWYLRGQKMAEQGKFPDSDFYLKKCQAAGANINHQQLDRGFKSERESVCDTKIANQRGREGAKYSFPLCLNYNEANMKNSYNKGLSLYCRPDRAKIEGSTGKKYNNVCPSNVEANFLASYTPAYRSYLKLQIKNENIKLNKANKKLAQLEIEQKKLKEQQLNHNRFSRDTVNYKIQGKLKTINFKIQDLKSDINEIQSNVEKLMSIK